MHKTGARMGRLQHLIIVTGAPATGKSTLAPLVARRYGSTLLTKDEIKEELFDILGAGDASWSRRLSDASFSTMFALAGDALGSGGSVVLEGNMRVGEHEGAIHALLARASGIRCVQVLCTVAEDVRRARHEGAPASRSAMRATSTPSPVSRARLAHFSIFRRSGSKSTVPKVVRRGSGCSRCSMFPCNIRPDACWCRPPRP